MYVSEQRQHLRDVTDHLLQKEHQAQRQAAALGGGLTGANQLRDRPELDREMERLEKACAHVSGLVSQLEHRLSSVLVPRPEDSAACTAESHPGSTLGQAIRANVNQLDSTAARLITLMDSLAV